MHNFTLVNLDTDAISICKQDMSPFTKEEQESLLDELNSKMPELIKFAPDGYFQSVVVIKAKNYIMYDGKKIKIKGSALKATTKEPALKEFIKRLINLLLEDKKEEVVLLYNEYVKEIVNLKDIKRWLVKKTITEKVLSPERANEQKVLDAIDMDVMQEGDKVHLYFTKEGALKQAENWTGDHDPDRLLLKLYKTTETFQTILPKGTFLNYSLKKNKKLLEELTNESNIQTS